MTAVPVPTDAVSAHPAPARADWRDTLREATDLALLGFAVALAALPVLTLAPAVATAVQLPVLTTVGSAVAELQARLLGPPVTP